VGAVYLVVLPLIAAAVARAFGGGDNWWLASLMVLVTPIIVVWGGWFIPEVYALVMSLMLLYSVSAKKWAIAALPAVGVLAHLGVALWLLLLLVFSTISRPRLFLPLLITIAILFYVGINISHTAYTTIKTAVDEVLKVITSAPTAILSGHKPSIPSTWLGNFASFLPVAVITIFALNAFLYSMESKNYVIIPMIIYSALMLLAGLIGVVYMPVLVLDRYLGLPSIALLATLAPVGLRALASRGRIGLLFIAALLALAIVSFIAAGTFAPYSPVTLNPNVYSIYGILTYGQTEELNILVNKLQLSIITDWRSGVYMTYLLYSEKPANTIEGSWCDVWPKGGGQIIFLGCYNTVLNGQTISLWLGRYSFWLLYRWSSSVMPESYGPGFNISNYEPKTGIVYQSNNFIIIH
jgi:hypothetical protein